MTRDGLGADAFAAVRDAARTHGPDRYVAALLAPRRAREDLIALAAFLGEIARIREAASDPALAQIRLQWWRDALELPSDQRTGNPVADAFREVLRRLDRSQSASGLRDVTPSPRLRHAEGVPPARREGRGEGPKLAHRPEPAPHPDPLPASGEREFCRGHALALDMIDAHADALDAPPASGAVLEAFAARTDGAAFRLAAAMIGGDASEDDAAFLDAAGRAYGLARLSFQGLSPESSHQRSPIGGGPAPDRRPPDPYGARGALNSGDKPWNDNVEPVSGSRHSDIRRLFEDARALSAHASRAAFAAALSLALVEPYLRALEEEGDPSRRRFRPSPLTRVWRLWRANALGRF